LNDSDQLLDGELSLGQFQISIMRYTPGGWVPTVPPLQATVTNYRMVLQPQQRRRVEPASIPNTFVTRVQDVLLDGRVGVAVHLKTGHQMHFVSLGGAGESFSECVRQMLASPIGNRFEDELEARALLLLIARIRLI
jgi:hypothetical protein